MTWEVSAGMNLIIGLAYFAICTTILRGLITTGQLRRNPLALATGAIFFTCAVHHGAHTVHMLAPIFHVDVLHGLAMRRAFSWQTDVWDAVGAVVAVYYLTLRRSYGALLRTPEMFRDEVQLAAANRIESERAILADAEELAGAGSFAYDISSGQIRSSAGMHRILGMDPPADLGALTDGVDQRDRQPVSLAYAEALAGGTELVEVTYRIVRPNGAIRWLETRSRIKRDEHGTATQLRGVAIDLTARHEIEHLRNEAERTLRERERLLRSVIDNDRSLVYVKDVEGRYLLYNTRFADTFALAERAEAEGLRADEVLLGRDDTWLDPALAAVWRENDLRAQAGAVELEEFSDHPERGRITYESIKFPLFDDDQSVYATCGISLDTTDRADERLQLAAAARYFEVSSDLMVAAGFDGYFKNVNPAIEHILGWSEGEFLNRPFIDMVHPDDRAATLREVGKLAQGQVTFNFVNRYEAKDGSYRWLDLNAILSPDEDLIYCAARDVTDRKRAEAALSSSELRTRQIIETAHDAFVAVDASGLVTDWNPQAQATFGWSQAEALARDLAELIIPVPQRQAHRRGLRAVAAGAESQILGRLLELTAVHRNGQEFRVEVTISPVEGESGYCFNAFLRDISDRRRAQEDLRQARDQALKASRMKSMFVANVSHEIRTPMNGVIGMCEILLGTALGNEQREYAEMIASSGEALLDVIDDILDFSKIEAGSSNSTRPSSMCATRSKKHAPLWQRGPTGRTWSSW